MGTFGIVSVPDPLSLSHANEADKEITITLSNKSKTG